MERVITMAHGAGGAAARELIEQVFRPAFFPDAPLNDSAVVPGGGTLALTTDSFVVAPRFFSGGDIGRLAVCGTVNDLAVSGATPRYLTCGMIIEAGFPIDELQRVVRSMRAAADEAGVSIVTGDTKVVEKGRGDGLYVNTAGVGVFAGPPLLQLPQPGDTILASAPLARHGVAVLCAREELAFDPPIVSDVAPLNGLIAHALSAGAVSAMRDPTRGGAAATLCEWARGGIDITVDEAALPVDPDVYAACELLGLEPLHIANEGVVIVATPRPDEVLAALRAHPLGKKAAAVGRVTRGDGRVLIKTRIGTVRILDMPRGELLPRIC